MHRCTDQIIFSGSSRLAQSQPATFFWILHVQRLLIPAVHAIMDRLCQRAGMAMIATSFEQVPVCLPLLLSWSVGERSAPSNTRPCVPGYVFAVLLLVSIMRFVQSKTSCEGQPVWNVSGSSLEFQGGGKPDCAQYVSS